MVPLSWRGVVPPVRRTDTEERDRAARKGKWSPTWYGDDTLHLSLLLHVRAGEELEDHKGAAKTKEEALVYGHDLDLFVTVQLLDGSLAVPSLGKLCEGTELFR